jgi:hypothetical protein
VAQVVKYLPSKLETLSSNPRTAKDENKNVVVKSRCSYSEEVEEFAILGPSNP